MEEKNLDTFGDRLNEVLIEKQITPYRLHKMTGIAQSSISNYIHNKTKPDRLKLREIAHALNTPAIWLYDGDFEEEVESPKTNFPTLKQRLKSANIKTHFIAKILGKKEGTITKAIYRESITELELRTIAKSAGVDPAWLISGVGEMLVNTKEPVIPNDSLTLLESLRKDLMEDRHDDLDIVIQEFKTCLMYREKYLKSHS